nr:reverse transcriptase domain-containing protein [Tanacetum cinerariifolium]
MRTRRSYFPPTATIPRRSRKQTTNVVEPEIRTIVEMADNRTMAQMLQAPIEGYEDAIVVPPINANNFELKQTLINLVQSNQFTERQDLQNHLRFFNKVTSTFRHPEAFLFSPANTIPRHSCRKNTSIVESEIRTNPTMADNRTMAQMLQAPIEGYEDAIVVPPINANNFELKQTLINLVQSNQFTGRQDPHNNLRFFNKVTSTFRHPEVPNTTVNDDSNSKEETLSQERLLHDDPIPLPDILDFSNVVRGFLPFFTYPVTSSIFLSSGSEDIIFDPGINHFSSLKPGVSHRSETFMKFNIYPNHWNESPMEILSSTCSPMDQ